MKPRYGFLGLEVEGGLKTGVEGLLKSVIARGFERFYSNTILDELDWFAP
jgi:hypothetical protein